MTKAVSLTSDTIKVALLDVNHEFHAADATWADVSANEISGTNYVAGGVTLAGKTVTIGGTTKWDATNTLFANVTLTAWNAVIYDVTNSNSLICSFGFGQSYSPISDDFTIQWDNVNEAIMSIVEA